MSEAIVERSPIEPAYEAEDAIVRLGVIALSTDLTAERDAWLARSENCALHVTRVAQINPTTPENLRLMEPRLAGAAALLADVPRLAAVYYGCTSATVVIGEEPVRRAIASALPGVTAITPPDAAARAFEALGVGRIALVTPYRRETTAPMIEYFERRGLEVACAHGFEIDDDRDMARVAVASIEEAAVAADRPDVDGIFFSCTAVRAVSAVEAVERRLGKPMVTSNLAGFWALARAGGAPAHPRAPGRLFSIDARRGRA